MTEALPTCVPPAPAVMLLPVQAALLLLPVLLLPVLLCCSLPPGRPHMKKWLKFIRWPISPVISNGAPMTTIKMWWSQSMNCRLEKKSMW